MDARLAPALLAEFLGTFALIFCGAGSVAVGGSLLAAAFAHGGVVIGFAYAFGHVSGTHINPAVTLAVWSAGLLETRRALAYVAVQLAGGLAGALLLAYVLGGTGTGLGVTVLAEGLEVANVQVVQGVQVVDVTPLAGFLVEAVLTFLLVTSVFNAGISGKATAVGGVAIGFTLVALILVGGPLTGAALNPARTLGPALATGITSDLWVYLAGPPVGGLLAAWMYRRVFETAGG